MTNYTHTDRANGYAPPEKVEEKAKAIEKEVEADKSVKAKAKADKAASDK